MPTPSELEKRALGEAWYMLRYACLAQPKIDPSLVNALNQAWNDFTESTWTQRSSELFWSAFSSLSTLIKPVTIDCLTATDELYLSLSPLSFFYGRKKSLGEVTSQVYVFILAVTLCLTVLMQFYSQRHQALTNEISSQRGAIVTEVAKFVSDDTQFNKSNSDDSIGLNNLLSETEQVYSQCTSLEEEDSGLASLSILPQVARGQQTKSKCIEPASDTNGSIIDDMNIDEQTALNCVNDAEIRSLDAYTGIIDFCIPILYATIGAIAYILRTISAQLKATTFSVNSPIRHAVRLGLGVMMGLIVGLFSNLTKSSDLEPSAVAFLAGYGVEVFFSTFDGLIERFKEPGRQITT